MRRPWRAFAVCVFGVALLIGGFAGEELLALSDAARESLQLYTELITVAHEKYGNEVSYKELVYASIQGMLRTLDPHTSFLTQDAYSNMRERQQSTFYGLGIFVGTRNGQLTVITPIPGTPADKMGMRAGDVISMIDGKPTAKMTQDEAIRDLKGPKGTSVRVTLLRPGFEEPIEIEIVRAEIPQNTVQYAYMLDEATGYLNIRDFSRSTGSEVARALDDLRSQGMMRLILDLRNNGGGLLDQAIEVADQFVPGETKIVETRGRTRSSYNAYFSSGHYEELGLPLVVLVNGSSASAAEILSGTIQDHDVGLILGEPTWGKGLVQTVYTLPYGAGLALTTARYYTPSGRLIQRDYTSYWDYTLGEGHITGDEPVDESHEVFHTDLGREVYGGGGITPDYLLEPKPPHNFVQRLILRSVFFNFAVELNNRTPIESPEWSPSDEDLERFRNWLIEEEYATREQVEEVFADPDVVRDCRARLRFEALNSAFGLEAGHRAQALVDEQIKRAFELFPEAGDLLRKRQLLSQQVARKAG